MVIEQDKLPASTLFTNQIPQRNTEAKNIAILIDILKFSGNNYNSFNCDSIPVANTLIDFVTLFSLAFIVGIKETG